jgi:hypothetical protein
VIKLDTADQYENWINVPSAVYERTAKDLIVGYDGIGETYLFSPTVILARVSCPVTNEGNVMFIPWFMHSLEYTKWKICNQPGYVYSAFEIAKSMW